MAELIINCLEEIGPHRFLGGVTDNCSAMLLSRRIIVKKYPHLVFYGCVAHILNLLMLDLCKTSFIENIMKISINLVKEIVNSSLKSWFDTIQKQKGINVSLKQASKTRFAGNAITLGSVLSNKQVFKQIAIDIYPGNQKFSLKHEAKEIILKDKFWQDLEQICKFLKKILYWITVLEAEEAVLSIVCLALSDIKLALDNFISEAGLTDLESMQMHNYFKLRKDMAVTNLHLAANLLDPQIKGSILSGSEFLEAMEYTEMLAKKFSINNNVDLSAIAKEITQFVNSSGLWSNSYVEQLARNQDSITYWQALKKCSPLADLAIKILLMPSSSAATERTFSTRGFIHRKLQNSLTNERASRLTYIKQNYTLMDLNLKGQLQDFKNSFSKPKHKKISLSSLTQSCIKNANIVLDSTIPLAEFSMSDDFSENIDDSDYDDITQSEGEINESESEEDIDFIEFVSDSSASNSSYSKEIQKEVEKQLQSAKSLAEALQQMFRIQHIDRKKRKNVDVPRFEGECFNKPEILERLKDTESKKAAKQVKKQHKLSSNGEQQINQATSPTKILAANQFKRKKCQKKFRRSFSNSKYGMVPM
ncbi:uncharacterized protein LOC136085692 [Hydra vulgaris]|uniref:Uncharacterized protein LOC136085692 n=1 Tax=Hydra vulgaris TaxID=6087 RepID=A0ABM4CMN7_HYDVU